MARIVSNRFISKCQIFMLIATAVSIPFSVQTNRIVVIILAVATVLVTDWSALKESFRFNKRILIGSLILALNCLGLLYSSNLHDGLKIVERSTALAIIPILLLMVPPSKESVNKILTVFMYACVTVSFYCLLYALWRIYETNSLINLDKITDRPYYYFINNELTSAAMNLSPIYLGLYLNLCIAILLVRIFIEKKRNWEFIALLLVLHFFQAIVFSLNAIASLTALWTLVVIQHIASKTLRQKITVSLFFIITIGIAIVNVYHVKPLHDRLFVNLDYDFKNAHVGYWSGITLRLAIWECASESIKEAPVIGYGTGDADGALRDQYSKKNFDLATMLDLNAHNQFLQSYLMHGVIGVCLLIALFVIPLHFSLKTGNWTLIMFLTILFTGFFTECILLVQKGIIFYSLFFPLLYFPFFEKND